MNNWIGLTTLPKKVFSRWEAMLVMCLIDFVGSTVKLALGPMPFVDMAITQMDFVAKYIVMAENRDTLYIGGYGSDAPAYSESIDEQALAYQKSNQNVSAQRDTT